MILAPYKQQEKRDGLSELHVAPGAKFLGKRLRYVRLCTERRTTRERSECIDARGKSISPAGSFAHEMQENGPRRKLRKPIIRWISRAHIYGRG